MNCSICYLNYNIPVVNNCGHTFCRKCILEYKKRISECPLCRVPLSNHLPINYTLLDILDKSNDINKFYKYFPLFYLITIVDLILFFHSQKYRDVLIILLHVILCILILIKITIETIKAYKNTTIFEYFFNLFIFLLILPPKYHYHLIIITTVHYVYSLIKRFYL
jgi:hypothetical protein